MSEGKIRRSSPDASQNAFSKSYIRLRNDILNLIPEGPLKNVLDLGCATGAMGEYLKEKRGARVFGIEYDQKMSELAQEKLENVWNVDLNKTSLLTLNHPASYDLIIIGDILEHLVDPWTALKEATQLLNKEGHIITSVPNIGHYTTILSLAFSRKWPYRSRGIHDRTHLRFFTKRNLKNLFSSSCLAVVKEKRILRILENGCFLDPVAKVLDFPPFRSFLVFQYLHLLKALEDRV
jgi:2-polyprenyl-3-methyl-5-hydroxy-6-metoxy-1,4-benzoquinol methylase